MSSNSPYCRRCPAETPDSAPLCPVCLERIRRCVEGAERYVLSAGLSWQGLRDNLRRDKKDIEDYEQWKLD